jgi:hypothetical protein
MPRYDSTLLCGVPLPTIIPDKRPSQFNDFYQRSISMPYGRALRGVDDEEASAPFYRDSWSGADDAVLAANKEDDAVGNGIFDGEGAAPVQHAGDGVFQAHYAEPGFLYREKLTQPSATVDSANGAPVVFRPAGGGWPADMEQEYRPYDNQVWRHYDQASGLGDITSGSPSLGQWAVAGLVVGAAVALVWGTLKAKG